MKDKLLYTFGIIFILWGIFCGIVLSIESYKSYQKEKEGNIIVDCFDKYSNKIIGVECEMNDEWIDIAFVGGLVSIIFIGMGLIFVIPNH